jgi:hypothetical protein
MVTVTLQYYNIMLKSALMMDKNHSQWLEQQCSSTIIVIQQRYIIETSPLP